MDLERVYQKKTQLEHILLRPDSYIGSTERTEAQMWVKADGASHFSYKKIEYVPGFFKIFDEVLVNAADNYQRDKSMNAVDISIDRVSGEVRVRNNGLGIPVEVHSEHKMHIPEMIFGELLSGSNFNDNERKVTGGRNGYGAKLANIFSLRFSIDVADSRRGKRFRMTWHDNMTRKSAARIDAYAKSDYTEVSFLPDFARFHMSAMENDTYELFAKRVWDLAGVVHESVRVTLNGAAVSVRGFRAYVDLYFGARTAEPPVKIHHRGGRWEVVLAMSDGQFQQVSFVNAICTSRGGTHVAHVSDQIVENLLAEIQRKNKKLQIKPHVIRNNLWLFVNCLIENPAFDSQTKETLTTKASQFGSRCELPERFFKELLRSSVVQQIVAAAEQREDAQLARALAGKKKSKLLGIKKLEDANLAGTKDSHRCYLILTEGDSAKSLALAGMEVIGRDHYGVFPLKGKLLNVRDAKKSQIAANEEIQHLIEILGLQVGRRYEDTRSLRYGGVMIMSDQDVDGSHIKGLIINLIAHFWPSLFELRGFLVEFVTPLLKCFGRGGEEWFFGMSDFRQWANDRDMSQWKVKYYKGLGSSTDEEARQYFSRLAEHKIDFVFRDEEDRDRIDMAFSEKRVQDRKNWLSTYEENRVVDYRVKELRYRDFVDNEMIHFSVYDNMRSIPSLVDGLKPGQRKVLFACFRRAARGEIKVAQLAGYVGTHAAYHHGEASLQATIVGLAQNFVGSNNLNLLLPLGQFGTRAAGGKDAASARYIFTDLNPLTRFVFHPDDDHIVRYLNDDGQMVEPAYYIPIIPMVLVNGALGIGTGWSTSVPCYCPRQLANAILDRLAGHPSRRLQPFYRGFVGEIAAEGQGYAVRGCYRAHVERDVLEITELPLDRWTRAYKSFLEEMMREPALIEDLREHHTTRKIRFEIRLVDGQLARLVERGEIEKRFKLVSSLSTSNMVLFDARGIIQRYASEEAILDEFFGLRLAAYTARKEHLLSRLQRDLELLDNRRRFILAVVEERIRLRNVPRAEILRQMLELGLAPLHRIAAVKSTKEAPPEALREDGEPRDDEGGPQFGYLLSMPLLSLSLEHVQRIEAEFARKSAELAALRAKSESSIWREDIEAFLAKLDEEERREERQNEKEAKKVGPEIAGGKRKVKPRKKGGDEPPREAKVERAAPPKVRPPIRAAVPAALDALRAKREEDLSLLERLQLFRGDVEQSENGKTSSARPKLVFDD